MNLTSNSRYSRQQDIVPRERIESTPITIVGVGAIGRQVALQLSAMGSLDLRIIDFDTVEPENLAPQGFFECDLGEHKVEAVARTCNQINSGATVKTRKTKFSNLMFEDGVMFCCVDSIDTRAQIFKNVADRCELFVDGRMSAEFLRVLSVFDTPSREYYTTQIFPANEAYSGSCTAKSTIYCSNIAAGIMVAQFAKWLRDIPLDKNIEFNTLTNEIVAV